MIRNGGVRIWGKLPADCFAGQSFTTDLILLLRRQRFLHRFGVVFLDCQCIYLDCLNHIDRRCDHFYLLWSELFKKHATFPKRSVPPFMPFFVCPSSVPLHHFVFTGNDVLSIMFQSNICFDMFSLSVLYFFHSSTFAWSLKAVCLVQSSFKLPLQVDVPQHNLAPAFALILYSPLLSP
jgi:hypothetical protein